MHVDRITEINTNNEEVMFCNVHLVLVEVNEWNKAVVPFLYREHSFLNDHGALQTCNAP